MDTPVKQQIIDTTRMLLADGFLDGHVAMRCRSDASKFLMAKARQQGKLQEKDIRIFHVKNGEPIDGNHDASDASAERFVHAAIFAARPDIKCSIHTHATALKALSASSMQLPAANSSSSNASRNHQSHRNSGGSSQQSQSHNQRQQQHHQPKHQQHLMTKGAGMAYPQPMWQAALQLQVKERKRMMASQIIKQIEFYLGDTNLPYDSYLLNQMERLAIKAMPSSPPTTNSQQEVKESAKTGRAWLPLDLIIKFKRMQMILSPLENNIELRRQAVAEALQESKILELSQDGLYIRRRFHFPKLSANPTTLQNLPVQ
eukprot:CAMPEP_0185255428 /NCGR_PEP_ID=MMETSP1359-20130426/4461_1 /TAXON_ID=552665 /ORGANISM="Bigelowiella longifila, Strain CCMP242" /LENGTH=315 /DNA_ID=CAMNT_0027839319 /DNA_START=177 /DNA_END=1124 /DNA_ORIENTATION=+